MRIYLFQVDLRFARFANALNAFSVNTPIMIGGGSPLRELAEYNYYARRYYHHKIYEYISKSHNEF